MARKIVNGKPVPYMRGGVIYEHIYELTLYDNSENADFEIVFRKFKLLFPSTDYVYIHHTKDTLEDGTPKSSASFFILLSLAKTISKCQCGFFGVPSSNVSLV